MKKKILIVNADACIGCRMCEAICSLVHYGAIGISHARLKVIRYDHAAFFNPVVCMQCAKPYCAAVCPSNAITKKAETGLVHITKVSPSIELRRAMGYTEQMPWEEKPGLSQIPVEISKKYGIPVIVILREGGDRLGSYEVEKERRRLKDYYLQNGVGVFPT